MTDSVSMNLYYQVAISQNNAAQLTHNIGGDPDDYIVDMQYQSSGSGVNQRYYGGADFGANPPSGMSEDDRVGAYWHSLTNSTITVYRQSEDIYAAKVRIRIWRFWKPPQPDYDSGWLSITAGSTETLSHNLGGNVSDYLVDLLFRSTSNGVNRRFYGGVDIGVNDPPALNENDRVGAYWSNLSTSTISVHRRPDDIYVTKVRIRIWRMPTPDYDSGWFSQSAGAFTRILTHNLGGSVNDYLVDMQYKNATDGINQHFYSGNDLGASPPSGMSEDDRVGAREEALQPAIGEVGDLSIVCDIGEILTDEAEAMASIETFDTIDSVDRLAVVKVTTDSIDRVCGVGDNAASVEDLGRLGYLSRA